MLTTKIKCPTCGVEAGRQCVKIGTDKPVPHLHTSRWLPKLISINQAAGLGIDRLKKPVWAGRTDHLKIDIIDGGLGPWVHLYSPGNESINGRDPQSFVRGLHPLMPIASQDSEEFEPYDGPLPDSEEYRAEVRSMNEWMA